MRGDDTQQAEVFSYISPEARIPKDHPLRPIRRMVDEVLEELSQVCSAVRLHRATLDSTGASFASLAAAGALHRSERLLMEQLDYNLLFRWFVGLNLDDRVWDATVFSKNRDRLLEGDIAEAFFAQVLEQAERRDLLSDEHFTVDGTLVEAWAGQKSFKKKGSSSPPPDDPGNPTVDFRGDKRSNSTHRSTTDPDARLYRKGDGLESKLCYLGHVLMENRNGLAVDAMVTQATGTAERDAADMMVTTVSGDRRVTLGADKNYDTRQFVATLRRRAVTPHVAQNTSNRRSAIDARTTRHDGYQRSQRKRKRVEEIFGWLKTVGLIRKTRHRGEARVGWMFVFTTAVYNLIRIRNLVLESG